MNLLAQSRAVDILHGDEVAIGCDSDFVNVRDVWMIERCGSSRFLFEASHPILVRGDVDRQDLQSDFAIQTVVLSEIDLTHTTRAQQGANLVTPELCFGGKGHEDIEPQISRINTDYFYLCNPCNP